MKIEKHGAPVAECRAATLNDIYIRLLIGESSVAPGKNNNVTAYLTLGEGVEVDWNDWSVRFDIDGTAVFIDLAADGLQETQLPVTKDSAMSAHAHLFFTAAAETAGKITATVMGKSFPDGFGQSAKVKYAFADSLVKSIVNLKVNTNFGDGKSLLEFSGRLINAQSGNGVAGAGIMCSIPGSDTAAFQGFSPGEPGLAQTDPNGRFSINFTDTVSIETAITAEDDEQTVLGFATYHAVPAPLLTLAVERDHAAANGYDQITLVATLVQKDTGQPYPESYELVIDPGSPGVLMGETAPYQKSTDSNGQVSWPMHATARGTGIAIVTLDGNSGTTAYSSYTFTSAWQRSENVTFNIGFIWKEGVIVTDNIKYTFDGAHVYIPGDGLQQCYGLLSFVPTDSHGGALTADNLCTIEELIAAIPPTPAPGGQPDSSVVTVSFEQKDEYDPNRAQWYKLDSPPNTYTKFGQVFRQSVAPGAIELTCLISVALAKGVQDPTYSFVCNIYPNGGRPGEGTPVAVMASTPSSVDGKLYQDYLTVLPADSGSARFVVGSPLAPDEAG